MHNEIEDLDTKLERIKQTVARINQLLGQIRDLRETLPKEND